jgi:hypothetical protein
LTYSTLFASHNLLVLVVSHVQLCLPCTIACTAL